jgi:hypothetical protein
MRDCDKPRRAAASPTPAAAAARTCPRDMSIEATAYSA